MTSSALPPSFDEVLARIAGVDGWLSDDQAARLYDAARSTQPGQQIVEIGSYRGRSTIVLAAAAPEGVTVVAIDPHAGTDRGPGEIHGYAAEAAADHEVFRRNLVAAEVDRRVRHVRQWSRDAQGAVDGAIAVLYIDGAHRYRPALDDIRAWGQRVRPGGTMLIHDSFSSVGVTLAIGRELLGGRTFRYVGRSRSLAEYRADLRGSAGARLANAARQVAQLPWFIKNLLLKALLTAHLGAVVERFTRRQPEWPY